VESEKIIELELESVSGGRISKKNAMIMGGVIGGCLGSFSFIFGRCLRYAIDYHQNDPSNVISIPRFIRRSINFHDMKLALILVSLFTYGGASLAGYLYDHTFT